MGLAHPAGVTLPLKPRGAGGWTPSRLAIDPLAVLLRARYPTRAALARASGLKYQSCGPTQTACGPARSRPRPSSWPCWGIAVDPDELDAAVTAALLSRPGPPLTFAHSERFCDAAPAQVWATLLDEGIYLGSQSTFYRLLHTVQRLRP